MIKAFPKIFAIGTDYIKDLFKDEVEVTEKIDGSQFSFGKIDSEIVMRSKGRQIFPESVDKMFKGAVEYVTSIEDKIPDDTVFYCEYLQKPHHNILDYEKIPANHLILFGVSEKTATGFEKTHATLKTYADKVGIDIVPLMYSGKINKVEELMDLLEKDSVLGKTKVEGIVVKNYHRQFLLGGQPIPVMMGKYVSEAFKETHRKNWGKKFTGKGKWATFKESFRTEARWEKSIQHLRDSGELENAPRDIGKLLKAIHKDIEEEEKENIKNFLWKEFSGEVFRYATSGFPEWYKKKLLEKAFEKTKTPTPKGRRRSRVK